MKTVYTLSTAQFDRDLDQIEESLADTKASTKEVTRARLILEEAFYRMRTANGSDDDFTVSVVLHQRLGTVSLQIISPGAPFDPLSAPPLECDAEDAFRFSLLNGFKYQIDYKRNRNENILAISIHERGSHKIRDTLMCMISGILIGIAIRYFLSADSIQVLESNCIAPIRTICLSLLKLMVAPVVFFSVLSGLISMSDKSSIGKRGGKLIIISVSMMLCITAVMIAASLLVFRSGNTAIAEWIAEGAADAAIRSFSFSEMIVSIVPSNIIEPFTGENILQTLFLAVFLGAIINAWPQAGKIVETVEFLNKFCARVLSAIVKLVPAFVLISMIYMILDTGFGSFLTLGQLILGNILGMLVVLTFDSIAVLLFAGISPVKYLKKLIRYSVIPFSLSSSTAAIPYTLEFCSKELGINESLSAFSIPVGIQFNKAGACTFLSMASIMAVRACGLPLTPSFLCKLFFAVFIMSMAKPSVPSAGIVCLSSVFQIIGVPPQAVEIVLCVLPVLNMFNTVTGSSTNVTSTTILARTENCIEK